MPLIRVIELFMARSVGDFAVKVKFLPREPLIKSMMAETPTLQLILQGESHSEWRHPLQAVQRRRGVAKTRPIRVWPLCRPRFVMSLVL